MASPVTPGARRRLQDTCRECGWADLWEIRLYRLEIDGPVQIGAIRDCARCAAARRREMGRA